MAAATALVEGKMDKTLKTFLKNNLDLKDQLAVSDNKLAVSIKTTVFNLSLKIYSSAWEPSPSSLLGHTVPQEQNMLSNRLIDRQCTGVIEMPCKMRLPTSNWLVRDPILYNFMKSMRNEHFAI